MKNIGGFYLKIFEFLEVKSSICLNRHVFVMCRCTDCTEPFIITLPASNNVERDINHHSNTPAHVVPYLSLYF